MNAQTALAAANNALLLLEDIAIEIKREVEAGNITLEQEQNLKMRTEQIFSPANEVLVAGQKPPLSGFPVEPGHPAFQGPPLPPDIQGA